MKKKISNSHLEERSLRQDLNDKCRDYFKAENISENAPSLSEIFTPTRLRSRLKMTSLLFALAAILSAGIASESWAEVVSCVNGVREDGISSCEKCGANCNWSFDTVSGKLSVSGSGAMYNYNGSWDSENKKYLSNTPWDSYKTNIKSVDVQGVSNIGTNAFYGTQGVLKTATIADSVTSIGPAAFYSASISSITLPESLTDIKSYSFEFSGLTSVVIPDSVESIGHRAFAYNSGLTSVVIPDSAVIANGNLLGVFSQNYDTVKIICKGDEESCASLASRVRELGYNMDNFDYADSDTCIGSYIYENGKCHKRNENQCNDTENYYYNGASCVYRPSNGKVNCVSASYKENDGYCDRIRYTPAEAAKVLRDDNTNVVTITFKMR